jgi:hypothetical protein
MSTRRSRVGRYGLWQMRDYLLERGFPTFLVNLLFGWIFMSPLISAAKRSMANMPDRVVARYGGIEAARAAQMQEVSGAFLAGFIGSVIFLGALFAMNGIVANDRKQGFYRFLFAKPVTPERYYGQAFVLHWVGFLVVMLVLGLLYGWYVAPVVTGPFFAMLALMFLAYAGIAFVLSAAARWDWLSLVAMSVFSTYLWTRYGDSSSILAKLLYLLPPLHRTSEVYTAAAHAHPLPWSLIAWLAGYGAVCFVLGLVVLRHRRLAIP